MELTSHSLSQRPPTRPKRGTYEGGCGQIEGGCGLINRPREVLARPPDVIAVGVRDGTCSWFIHKVHIQCWSQVPQPNISTMQGWPSKPCKLFYFFVTHCMIIRARLPQTYGFLGTLEVKYLAMAAKAYNLEAV